MAAGNAIVKTADVMLTKGKKVAAALLEASEADIQYRKGNFEVVGTDRRVSLFETARRAKEMNESLDTKEKAETPLTFPNGVHIAEVEIDPDSGKVDVVTYTAIDDCGNMLNPMIVEGQVHGSLANGFGQALLEDMVYDTQGGQLVSGSFMDYAMPRAHDMPVELREAIMATPATSNPLGVKGTGEAGTTAAIAALMNAIAHAIPNGAADHMDMPATPAKVWAACRKALRRPIARDAASVADLHPAHVPAAGPGAEYATLQGAIGPGFVGIVVVIIRAVIAERHEGKAIPMPAPMMMVVAPATAISSCRCARS